MREAHRIGVDPLGRRHREVTWSRRAAPQERAQKQRSQHRQLPSGIEAVKPRAARFGLLPAACPDPYIFGDGSSAVCQRYTQYVHTGGWAVQDYWCGKKPGGTRVPWEKPFPHSKFRFIPAYENIRSTIKFIVPYIEICVIRWTKRPTYVVIYIRSNHAYR